MKALNQNERIKKAILAVIDTQVRDNNPPETAKTLARLQQEGHSKEEAYNLVGYVVGYEVLAVMGQGKQFDETSFIAKLRQLPDLSWLKTEGI